MAHPFSYVNFRDKYRCDYCCATCLIFLNSKKIYNLNFCEIKLHIQIAVPDNLRSVFVDIKLNRINFPVLNLELF